MARMIRKQLYLGERHDRALKDLAARQRRSEADVVREAVAEYAERARTPLAGDRAAWDEAVAFMRGLAGRAGSRRPARPRVPRERLYEQELNRGRRRAR